MAHFQIGRIGSSNMNHQFDILYKFICVDPIWWHGTSTAEASIDSSHIVFGVFVVKGNLSYCKLNNSALYYLHTLIYMSANTHMHTHFDRNITFYSWLKVLASYLCPHNNTTKPRKMVFIVQILVLWEWKISSSFHLWKFADTDQPLQITTIIHLIWMSI